MSTLAIAWGIALAVCLAPFAVRGWNRRHLTDAELFPELRRPELRTANAAAPSCT